MHDDDKTKYVLPLGRTTTGALYARITNGRTLYIHNNHEPLGYAILDEQPRRRGQRTLDEFVK